MKPFNYFKLCNSGAYVMELRAGLGDSGAWVGKAALPFCRVTPESHRAGVPCPDADEQATLRIKQA